MVIQEKVTPAWFTASTAALALVGVVLFGLLFVPLQSRISFVQGDDVFRNHLPLSDERPVVQVLTIPSDNIVQMSLVLVPYQGEPHGDVVVRLSDQMNGRELFATTIPAHDLRDDERIHVTVPAKALSLDQRVKLELRATESQEAAHVAVRFDDVTGVLDGQLTWGDTEILGTMAFEFKRRTTFYQTLADQVRLRADLVPLAQRAMAGAALVTMLLFVVMRWPKIRIRKWVVPTVVLVVIILGAGVLAWRLTLIDDIRGVSGGDAYNFLQILDRITNDGQFYHVAQKRLPGWPLVLVPTQLFTADTLLAARAINQTLMVLMGVGIVLLARVLKLSPTAALLGALLFFFDRDGLFTGLRPLAYPLLGVLVMAGLLVLFYARSRWRWLIAAGVLLGLAAQTRQEGLAVGVAVIGVVSTVWLFERRWRAAAALVIPFVVLILPYFVANAALFGDPFYTGYNDHPVTNIDRSWYEVQNQLGEAWAVVSSTWLARWGWQTRMAFDAFAGWSLTVGLLAAAAAWYGRRFSHIRAGAHIIGLAAIVAGWFVYALWLFRHGGGAVSLVTSWLVIAAGVGLVILVLHGWRYRSHVKDGSWVDSVSVQIGLVMLVSMVIYGVATWVHPAAKTYVSMLPYVALAAGVGIAAMLRGALGEPFQQAASWDRVITSAGWALGTVLVLSVVALPLIGIVDGLPLYLDKFNRKQVDDWLRYRSGLELVENFVSDDERVAIQHKHLPTEYFLGDRVVAFGDEGVEPTPQELREAGVRWVVWLSSNPLLKTFADQPDQFPVRWSMVGVNDDDDKIEVSVIEIP